MQITDSLLAGGLERVAVNLANSLPADRVCSHLCATRMLGPLDALVASRVQRVFLARKRFFDLKAARRLRAYIRDHRIEILHAHGSSVWLATLASLCRPHPLVLWHDHFGRNVTEERPASLYRLMALRLSGVVAVNESLAQWAREKLRLPANRVWYIPNFVCEPESREVAGDLPGEAGSRIVCVANFRRQKDQLNLLRAMRLVLRQKPSAHLILVGSMVDSGYGAEIQAEMAKDGLAGQVSWLGARQDVFPVLRACAIGVLSSISEGLPLALMEYGLARLPVVSTNVGQCAEVLDQGRAGLLVPASSPEALAQALLALLESPETRVALGRAFYERVRQTYSHDAILRQICAVYRVLLDTRDPLRLGEPVTVSS